MRSPWPRAAPARPCKPSGNNSPSRRRLKPDFLGFFFHLGGVLVANFSAGKYFNRGYWDAGGGKAAVIFIFSFLLLGLFRFLVFFQGERSCLTALPLPRILGVRLPGWIFFSSSIPGIFCLLFSSFSIPWIFQAAHPPAGNFPQAFLRVKNQF